MADIFDYLKWRGDLRFSQAPFNPVDALIFSTLSYICFDGIVLDNTEDMLMLKDAAELFFQQTDTEKKVRVKKDLSLLRDAADTERFGRTWITFYRNIFVPEEETQFAAMTFFLDDKTAAVVYRGTDQTLAGWKEDFNMTFYESIPAQREALRYLEDFAGTYDMPIRLTGHSKGGNLSVYAASNCSEDIRARIVEVYNHDGPGFTEHMMGTAGYLAMVPKIRTYIPQSSVVGMLLEHEEPYSVIRSRQIGPIQHDPYSWEVMGGDFIHMEDVTEESRFLDRTLKTWMAGMSKEERSELVDTVYELLTSGGASNTDELVHPRNVKTVVKQLAGDEKKRQILFEELESLVHTIRNLRRME